MVYARSFTFQIVKSHGNFTCGQKWQSKQQFTKWLYGVNSHYMLSANRHNNANVSALPATSWNSSPKQKCQEIHREQPAGLLPPITTFAYFVGVRTLRTQNILDPRHFGPRTLWHQCWTLRKTLRHEFIKIGLVLNLRISQLFAVTLTSAVNYLLLECKFNLFHPHLYNWWWGIS